MKITVGQNDRAAASTLGYLALDHDPRVRASLAINGRMMPSILATLAHDSDAGIRASVAANPTTPVPALVILARDSAESVRDRASGNSRISHRLKGFTQACLPDNDPRPVTAAQALACLVRDGGASTKRFVTERWALEDTPRPEVLAVLAYSPDLSVRAGVARNKNTNSDSLAMLAFSKDPDVLRGVGGNPNTPHASLEWLTTPEAYYWRRGLPLRVTVQREVAANPRTQPAALLELAESDDPEVLMTVAKNPSSPPAALAAVIDHFEGLPGPPWFGSWELRQALAEVGSHPNTPAHVLRTFADSGRQSWVVGNPSTPGSLLGEIAHKSIEGLSATDPHYGGADWDRRNESESLCKVLASNPATPPAVVKDLYDNGFEAEVGANPNAPSVLLARLAAEIVAELDSASSLYAMPSRLWHGYAGAGDTTESWWDFDPLEKLAANRNTPAATLAALAEFTQRAEGYHHLVDFERFESELFGLRRAIAANRNTPVETLRALLEAGHATIEDAPHAPAELKKLHQRNQDFLPGVRQMKARDRATPPASLAALAADDLGRSYTPSYSVLEDIAENPNCPEQTLLLLAEHANEGIRAAVARNPNASADALETLSADHSGEVLNALDLHHRFNLM